MRKDGLLARAQVVPRAARLCQAAGATAASNAWPWRQKQTPLAGALIAISERALDDDGNIKGFLIGGKTPGDFSVKRIGDFDIVDCATLPDGGFVVLERLFSWRQGVAMRHAALAARGHRARRVLDGPVLIEADLGYQIDNMEGLGVHRAANGDIVLTLVSDDNFSVIQRTILLQFTLLDRVKAAAENENGRAQARPSVKL